MGEAVKKWYLSKSVWVGGVTTVSGILYATGVIGAEISPENLLMILGVISTILRFVTKSPVSW